MARMTKLWQYEALCVLEVLGYVFAGPIATQVLVARCFAHGAVERWESRT